VQALAGQNNTLVLPIDMSAPMTVAVRATDRPDAEWFVVTTAQGKLLGRANTPARDSIVEYRPADTRFKVVSVGNNQFNIEAVQ
jgi:hypothetical protein